jgi:probable HAF family extracellular repeat protein
MMGIGLLQGNDRFPISYAAGINTAGWVVGWSATESGHVHAVLWDGTVLRDLTPDATQAQALGINSKGQAVGFFRSADSVSHAAAFVDGAVTDLGTLGNNAVALAINDSGRIVGDPAFIYDWPRGPMRNASPGRAATLSSVNDAGDAVGAFLNPSPERAILWREGSIIDLTTAVGDPSWRLLIASAINDAGVIVGWGRHNGADKGFIMTPR